MRIIGYADGRLAFHDQLGHGVDPFTVGAAHGFTTLRALATRRSEDGQLELDVAVRASAPEDSESLTTASGAELAIDPELDLVALAAAGEHPAIRQRVAGYALVRCRRGVLVTEYSDRTNAPGDWGLPGGGVKDDEDPAATVVREAYEETGQRVQPRELIAVHSSRWIGRSPHGRLEDFQAVRLVFRADCPDPGDPVVHDVGGTTASARWIRLEDWPALRWRRGWDTLIPAVLGADDGGG